MKPVRVLVHASDPVNRTGAEALPRAARDADILAGTVRAHVDVLVPAQHVVEGPRLTTTRQIVRG